MPSKKFKGVFFTVLLVLAGWFWLSDNTNRSGELGKKNNAENDTVLANMARDGKIAEAIIKDTDNDGLSDWEEQLWGTEMNKADTDGDGYSDKEETDGGHDPLNANSNPITGEKKKVVSYDAQNATSAFSAKDFFKDTGNLTTALARSFSFNADMGGVDISSDKTLSATLAEANNTTGESFKNFITSLSPQIDENELIVVKDNSPKSIQEYMQKSALIETKGFPFDANVVVAFYDAIKEDDMSAINENADYFNIVVVGLKNIPTPSYFLSAHKRKVELYMSLEKAFESIENIKDDPVKALLSIKRFQQVTEDSMVLQDIFLKLKLKYGQ